MTTKTKKRVLIQLDTDDHPSCFDSMVAIDSSVEHLLRFGGVEPPDVESIVHGALFTRGFDDLKSTAIFVGGSSVDQAEDNFAAARKTCFGPFQVSMMLDPNGSNTTAAAAVVSAARHIDLSDCRSLVLGATGPVGSRIAKMVVASGGRVTVASRTLSSARQLADQINRNFESDGCTGAQWFGMSNSAESGQWFAEHDCLFAAGATGVQFLAPDWLDHAGQLRVAIDLNAVPPLGLAGIESHFRGKQIGNLTAYGAIGVGGLKMKIHKRCLERLFESSTGVFDTLAILQLARESLSS